MPARVGAAATPSPRKREVRFRRVSGDDLRTAALAVVRSSRGALASQGALWRAVRARLRREEPQAGVTAVRLRRVLLETPGVRIDVEYAERPSPTPLSACPVCGGPLGPIRNRTLDGPGVVLGQRCRACPYWTHGRRRTPVRYTFRAAPGARATVVRPT